MPPRLEVVAQFTEDSFATKDRLCDRREKCRGETPVIRKGGSIYHVASRNPATPGRLVCKTCYDWYLQQPTTTVRPTVNTGVASGSNRKAAPKSAITQPPNAALIRQSVNAGQRGSTLTAPSIVPISHGSGSSTQPGSHLSHSYNQMRGPIIPTPGASVPGYSSNHTHYTRDREYWARAAARSSAVETIRLTISAVYEGSKKPGGELQGIPFGGIKEGKKDVDALTSAEGLICFARGIVIPKIKAFAPGFPWRDSEFVVRDAGWVDLSTYPPLEAYFYKDCISYNAKTSKPIFKTKAFILMVVVPASQWVEYNTFLEREQTNTALVVDHGLKGQSTGFSISHHDDSSLFAPEDSPAPADHAPPHTMTSKKRDHKHVHSGDSLIADDTQLPASKRLTAAAIISESPPRNAICQALEKGGTANVDVNLVINHIAETITFHPINSCPFDEILKDCMRSDATGDNRAAWKLDPMGGHAGQLIVNKSQKGLVGIGAFKTAHDGVLSLTSLTLSGLGSEQRQKVVIKQPFFRSRSTSGKVNIIQRYTPSTDLTKLFREANILYWAKSLLDLTYTFVDAAIKSFATHPPFNVPRLRFVDAGLALIHSSASKSVTGVYLVEEKILCGSNGLEFVKFIHNRDFGPSIESDDNGYDIAEFLVFTQHVQYVKTKGLAFISDYQGNWSLLTDPQILTDPSLGVGQDMFGDGNLTNGVKMFKEQHICNRYCRWPGFGLKAFENNAVGEDSESC